MVQQKPGILIVEDEKMVCDILLDTGSLEACYMCGNGLLCPRNGVKAHLCQNAERRPDHPG